MKLIASYVFFTFVTLIIFSASQGVAYAQQLAPLDNAIIAYSPSDCESTDNDELEKKYITSQSFAVNNKKACYISFPISIPHGKFAIKNHLIRAPPKPLPL